MSMKILVVEDEAALRTLISYNLEKEGFQIREAASGEAALSSIQEQLPDLVLLDWMIPSPSGLEVLRQLRKGLDTSRLPVILLTAKGEEQDKLQGLEGGADDYITKPFSPAELVARIKAVLRRAILERDKSTLDFADIHMDFSTYRVTRANRDITLSPTEFRLLRHFLRYPTRVFSREQLLDAVWGHDIYVEPRTVDVHIRRLRKALNAGGEPDLIRTVRSAGYAMDTLEVH